MSASGGARPLVIGIGNRDRGDDAAGPLVADELLRAGTGNLEVLVLEGDLSDLCLRWDRGQEVVVVDAVVAGRSPGTVVELDASSAELAASGGLVSTHGVGLAEAISLARLLDRLPARLTIIGIEAASFDHLAPPSAAVAQAVTAVAERLAAVLDTAG
jgi:hydrogenase maturation protease